MKTLSIFSVAAALALIQLRAYASDQQPIDNDFAAQYEKFRSGARASYSSFRDRCNEEYASFMRQSWESFNRREPLQRPPEPAPMPPQPYEEPRPVDPRPAPPGPQPTLPEPIALLPIPELVPQPLPIEPVRENPEPPAPAAVHEFDFYGLTCRVRLYSGDIPSVKPRDNNSVADAWQQLSQSASAGNTLRDCLELRISHGMCDWAYINMLVTCMKGVPDANSAAMLAAWLYCQSGYQMRLAWDGDDLIMLYGSRHTIFDKEYYVADGLTFYPLKPTSGRISMCGARFEGETPLSLYIDHAFDAGGNPAATRLRQSKRYTGLSASPDVNGRLMEFYDTYPTSALDGNVLSRWAMYAQTPISEATRSTLYPSLRAAIDPALPREAADKLLNWVQTGFEYRLDDEVWGHDRAFFAEESLFYPYCDCEDRSILFSHLVRDLLGLDVALVYYPGHLATAVCFDGNVPGDAVNVSGRRFVICDPTYIGAPVGKQMPGLDHGAAQAILLRR